MRHICLLSDRRLFCYAQLCVSMAVGPVSASVLASVGVLMVPLVPHAVVSRWKVRTYIVLDRKAPICTTRSEALFKDSL